MLGASTRSMTRLSPTTSLAQSAARAAISGSLITGGAPQIISYSTSPRKVLAVASATSLIRLASSWRTSSSRARMVPSIRASDGITLYANPASIWPMVSTAGFVAAISLATISWRLITIWDAILMGSTPFSGVEP